MTKTDQDMPAADNVVFLRGRLAAAPVYRDLPSGDCLAVFRLTVNRPPGERARVDSMECATVRPRVRQALGRVTAGDELELKGSLRRRFWRTPAGPASRYAVDVERLRVLTKAGRRGAASRARTPASA
jgi:single-strand DNA-binding protein